MKCNKDKLGDIVRFQKGSGDPKIYEVVGFHPDGRLILSEGTETELARERELVVICYAHERRDTE